MGNEDSETLNIYASMFILLRLLKERRTGTADTKSISGMRNGFLLIIYYHMLYLYTCSIFH